MFHLVDFTQSQAEVVLAEAFVKRAKGGVGEAAMEAVAQQLVDVLEADKEFAPAMLALAAMFMLQEQGQKARNMLKRIAKMPYAADQVRHWTGPVEKDRGTAVHY